MKKSGKWSRYLSVAATALLFLILVVCTLFGDNIYEWITPKVSVKKITMVIKEDGERYAQIPKTALTAEGCIYVVTSCQGFSRLIYRIQKYEAAYIESEEDASVLLVSTKLPQGGLVVTEPEAAAGMKDGEKVLLKR